MKVRLNKAHFPVTALGPGRRIGLWFQGCTIGCIGCCSKDTWLRDPDSEIELDDLIAWCRSVGAESLDGITITGGEPFEQPAALRRLLDLLHLWRAELSDPFDVLCYSGFPLRRLQRHYSDILSKLDALIPEPFAETKPQERAWRGSANQPLVLLSELGRQRYEGFLDAAPNASRRLQVDVESGAVWLIGIPDRRDLQSLETAARRRGVLLGDVSWRA